MPFLLLACVSVPRNEELSDDKPSLVYSLPPKDHFLYQPLVSAVESGLLSTRYGTLYHADRFKPSLARGQVRVYGSVDGNSLIRSLLAQTDIKWSVAGIQAGDREYVFQNLNLDLLLVDSSVSWSILAADDWTNLGNIGWLFEDTTESRYRISAAGGSFILEEGKLNRKDGQWICEPEGMQSPELLSAFRDAQLRKAVILRSVSRVIRGENDYEIMATKARGNEIFFLGEVHNVPEVQTAIYSLADYLNRTAGYTVFGHEGIFSTILEREQTSPPGFLHTELDVDHAIRHSQHFTVAFFTALAGKNDSFTARVALIQKINELPRASTHAAVHTWINDVESLFNTFRDGFASTDWDFIVYSLEVARSSTDFQFFSLQERPSGMSDKDVNEIRARVFRENIRRAWVKAGALGGSLVCRVGAAHAILTPVGDRSYGLGHVSEAYYFAVDYPATAGKTGSIAVFNFDMFSPKDKAEFSAIVAPGESLFFDLVQHAKYLQYIFPMYYYEGVPQFNGMWLVQ